LRSKPKDDWAVDASTTKTTTFVVDVFRFERFLHFVGSAEAVVEDLQSKRVIICNIECGYDISAFLVVGQHFQVLPTSSCEILVLFLVLCEAMDETVANEPLDVVVDLGASWP
jgi:hypothetical protein